MDEKTETSQPPLPWEHKAAIGLLALLAMQEMREGYLICTDQGAGGLDALFSAFPLLFTAFTGIAFGLWKRRELAFWLGIILVGSLAVLYLWSTIDVIMMGFHRPKIAWLGVRPQRGMVAPPRDPGELLWMIARNALLLAVPLTLLLGLLRESLRRSPDEGGRVS